MSISPTRYITNAYLAAGLNPTDIELLLAIEKGDEQGVATALTAGANPNAKTGNAVTPTPLHTLLLCQSLSPIWESDFPKYIKIMKLLIEYGADPTVENNCGIKPFDDWTEDLACPLFPFLVIESGDYELLKSILNKGVDPNSQDERYGQSLLHWAIYFLRSSNNTKAAQTDNNENSSNEAHLMLCTLLGSDMSWSDQIDINIQDRFGDTPLHWAVMENFGDSPAISHIDPRIVNVLLCCNANPMIANKQGNTPLDILRMAYHRDSVSDKEKEKIKETFDLLFSYLPGKESEAFVSAWDHERSSPENNSALGALPIELTRKITKFINLLPPTPLPPPIEIPPGEVKGWLETHSGQEPSATPPPSSE